MLTAAPATTAAGSPSQPSISNNAAAAVRPLAGRRPTLLLCAPVLFSRSLTALNAICSNSVRAADMVKSMGTFVRPAGQATSAEKTNTRQLMVCIAMKCLSCKTEPPPSHASSSHAPQQAPAGPQTSNFCGRLTWWRVRLVTQAAPVQHLGHELQAVFTEVLGGSDNRIELCACHLPAVDATGGVQDLVCRRQGNAAAECSNTRDAISYLNIAATQAPHIAASALALPKLLLEHGLADPGHP